MSGRQHSWVAAIAALAAWTWTALPAAAQSVRVAPSRTSIALGERVTVQIVLSGRFEETRGPDLSDFDVVGRSSGTSVTIVNGQMQQEHQVTLELAPKRAGNLVIGAIELVAGGRVVASSKPVTIRVSARGEPIQAPPATPAPPGGTSEEGGGAGAPPEAASGATADLARYAGRRHFLVPRIPDRPLYAGEPVYLEYVLYSASQISVADARIETPPSLKGFVVLQPRQADSAVRQVRIGGIPYDARVVWRAAVTALAPGRATLPPATAAVYAGDGFFVSTRRVASEAAAVDFLPVPAAGRPADFVEGTLGQFVVRATLDKTTVRVGDSALLTVDVTGTGNLPALKPPVVAESAGLRVTRVPSGDLDETVVDRGGVSGRRAFQYLLTPERDGTFDIGRIELPFFNTVSGKYERTRTDPIRLVAVGAGGGPIHEVRKDPVIPVIARSDLSPAPGRAEGHAADPRLIWAGVGGPLAVFLAAEAVARRRAWLESNGSSRIRRRALGDALRRLKSLSREGLSGGEFWGRLDAVIGDFLAARFGVSVAARTREELRAELLAAGASLADVEALEAEMEHCAFGRFAPSAAMDRDRGASVERVRRCLEGLDRARGGAA